MRKVFVIGAGAAGGSLAVSLKKAGFEIIGVHDPIRERAEKIAAAADSNSFWEALPEVIKKTDICFLAVPDSKVASTADEIARAGLNCPDQSWFHLAGSLSAEVLRPLSSNGTIIGAFHPAMAFPPGRVTEIPPGIFFGVDGDEEAVICANALAKTLGGKTVRVPARLRPLYHAATVFSSNYIVAILWQAKQMLLEAGLDDKNVEGLLTSLASNALNRARDEGMERGLSGPIRRGDLETVKLHLDTLKDNPDAEEIYRVLGLAATRLTERLGDANVDSLNAIKKILGG